MLRFKVLGRTQDEKTETEREGEGERERERERETKACHILGSIAISYISDMAKSP